MFADFFTQMDKTLSAIFYIPMLGLCLYIIISFLSMFLVVFYVSLFGNKKRLDEIDNLYKEMTEQPRFQFVLKGVGAFVNPACRVVSKGFPAVIAGIAFSLSLVAVFYFYLSPPHNELTMLVFGLSIAVAITSIYSMPDPLDGFIVMMLTGIITAITFAVVLFIPESPIRVSILVAEIVASFLLVAVTLVVEVLSPFFHLAIARIVMWYHKVPDQSFRAALNLMQPTAGEKTDIAEVVVFPIVSFLAIARQMKQSFKP